jgi:hypothetical protein
MVDFGRWLETHGLSKFVALFAESEVNFEVSPELA